MVSARPSAVRVARRAPAAGALLGLLLLPAAPAAAYPVQQGPPTASEPVTAASDAVLVDRLVAVVDEDPILLSQVDELIHIGLVEPAEGESEAGLRERVITEMVEERLRFHEVERSGFDRVPVEQVEERMAAIVDGFPSRAAFEERLRAAGLSRDTLRQIVARRLAVLSYVEQRLGARIFVGLDDIREYYYGTLTPELEARGMAVPPLDEVREEIRTVLKEQRLNAEIDRWTGDLYRDADVLIFEQPPEELPPVVGVITAP